MTTKDSLRVTIAIITAFWADFGPKFGWIADIPIFGYPYPDLPYSVYNFHGATMKIKGSLLMGIPNVKRFCLKIF